MSETNLKIIAYDSPDGGRRQNEIGEFVVGFNPNTFTVTSKIEYQKPDVKGQTGGDPQFEKIPPLEFSVEFTIDGTGVGTSNPKSGQKHDYVQKQIKKLREVTGSNLNGDIHRPNYLALLWGNFYIECVLSSLSITYTLFDREGASLRARVSCSFLERIAAGKGGRQSRLESADLTTYMSWKESDRLPMIAHDKYDNTAYYIQLARANKLKTFRDIGPGTQIVLPPLRENESNV